MSTVRRSQREWERKARKQSIRAARAMGCVCEPEVQFNRPDHPSAALGLDPGQLVSVAHDDWCPLLRVIEEREPGLARTQVVIYPKRAPRVTGPDDEVR